MNQTQTLTLTLSDARALISNPDHHCTAAYGRDMYGQTCIRAPDMGVIHDANWCEHIRDQYAAETPATMCLVTAIVVAAPDANEAANALTFAKRQAVAQQLIHERYGFLESANNTEPHATLLSFLDVAIGNSTLPQTTEPA